MKTEHQSMGYYNYKCDKPECYHCQLKHPITKVISKPPRAHEWKEDELKFLIENYGLISLDKVCIRLNKRTRDAVIDRAIMLRKKGLLTRRYH